MSSTAIHPSELAALTAVSRPDQARGGRVLILDLRNGRQRRRGSIPGSHPCSPGQLVSGEPPEGDLILVAQNGSAAAGVAEALHQAGYQQRLRHLDGGFPSWQDAGLPVMTPQTTGALLLRPIGLLNAALALLPAPRPQPRAGA